MLLKEAVDQTGLSKQCRPRSDAAECGVSSDRLFLQLIQQFLDSLLADLINSVDPDQMPQNAAFDQCLYRFPRIQQVLDTLIVSIKWTSKTYMTGLHGSFGCA